MFLRPARRAAGLAVLLAAVLLVVPATDAAPVDAKPIPEAVAAKVMAADIAFLKKGLSGTPEKRAVPTLKAVAMLVAQNAQAGMKGDQAEHMAGVRDQALKVAAAIAKKDYTAAKEVAAGLADAKGGDGKPLDLATLHKFDLAEVMSTFRATKVGGMNLQKDIETMAKKVTDVDAAGIVGGRVAAIAAYSKVLPPAEVAGDAKKKQWAEWNDEMATLGQFLAAEAAKGAKADKAVLQKKSSALEMNCKACHEVFRN